VCVESSVVLVTWCGGVEVSRESVVGGVKERSMGAFVGVLVFGAWKTFVALDREEWWLVHGATEISGLCY
jgi:hypothetical protein